MKVTMLSVLFFLTACATVQPIESSRTLAERLVEITSKDSNEIARNAMQVSMAPFIQDLKDKGYPEETILEINTAINDFTNDFVSDPILKARVADLYVGEFNREELQAILDFYQQPVGKKALEKLPALMQKSTELGIVLAQKHHEKFSNKLNMILSKSDCKNCED